MNHDVENFNQLWLSKWADLEAWSSTWLAEPQHRHAHDFFQLTFTRSGVGHVWQRGQSHHCPPGTGALIPPGEVHELRPGGAAGWVFDTLYISAADATSFMSSDGRRSIADLAPASFSELSVGTSFRALHRSVVRGDESLVQTHHLGNLLARLVGRAALPARAGGHTPNRGSLDRVRDYMGANVTRDVSLAELAAVAGVGECHLARTFRREYGLPPHAFHRQLRVIRARRLLKEMRPIADVAALTGFADQAHFTRHFKRLVGVTPGTYLRRIKNVQDG